MLSVHLRFTDSDYPFRIFKLFLNVKNNPSSLYPTSSLENTNINRKKPHGPINNIQLEVNGVLVFSLLGIPISSSNKIDGHDITEILLKVALTTINLT